MSDQPINHSSDSPTTDAQRGQLTRADSSVPDTSSVAPLPAAEQFQTPIVINRDAAKEIIGVADFLLSELDAENERLKALLNGSQKDQPIDI